MTSKVLENLSKMVRKSSQNTSKIDLEGGLEAAREPPLCGGDPKTSFWAILAPLWDPIWGPVLAHVGHRFLMFFWSAFLLALASIWAPKTPPKWDPKGGQNQNLNFIDFAVIYNTWATFEGAENHHFSMFFWNPVLGGLWEPILMILAHFWGPFWRPCWSLVGYPFCIGF